jgi:prophage regulatory protein
MEMKMQPKPSDGPPKLERLFKIKEVRVLAGNASVPAIYSWMKDGRFPRPVKIGKRGVAWREGDLIAWQTGLQTSIGLMSAQK